MANTLKWKLNALSILPSSGGNLDINSTGTLMIGATSLNELTAKLELTNNSSGATTFPLSLANAVGAASTEVALALQPTGSSTRRSEIRSSTNGSNQTNLRFFVSNAAAPAEAMRIDNTGKVGIGMAPNFTLQIKSASSSALAIGDASSDAGIALLLLGSSTTKNWAVANNYNLSGAFEIIQTTANGGTAPAATARLSIDSSGGVTIPAANLGIGVTADPNTALYIRPISTLSGANQAGIVLAPTFSSASTTAGYGMTIQPSTQAASFTMTDSLNFVVSNIAKGAGSTVTRQWGITVADLTSGTQNYGIRSQVTSGASKWNHYADGTADNYFAGNVAIGASLTSPSSLLHLRTDQNNATQVIIDNQTSNTAALSRLDIASNVSARSLTLIRTSTATTGTLFGFSLANVSAIWDNSSTSNGFLMGTVTVSPIVFGINSAEACRIDTSSRFQIQGGKMLLGDTGTFGAGTRINASSGISFRSSNSGADHLAIDTSGRLHIGSNILVSSDITSFVADAYTFTTAAAGTRAHAVYVAASIDAVGAQLFFAKTRTTTGSRPGTNIVTTGDVIMDLQSMTANDTSYRQAAIIRTVADGTQTNVSAPARIEFHTTPSTSNSSVERLRINNAGNILPSQSGVHNGGSGNTGNAANPSFSSGTYTPTNVGSNTNVTSITFNQTQWLRVGNVVTVSGIASLNNTASATLTKFSVSFPIASATTQAGCGGTFAAAASNYSGYIQGDSTNAAALFQIVPTGTGGVTIGFTFSYLIQ